MSEKERLDRRRQMARVAAQQFEDELSNQELILMRLDVLPQRLRQQDHENARNEILANIERIKLMIPKMYEEAGSAETTPGPEKIEPRNRAERRATTKANGKGTTHYH